MARGRGIAVRGDRTCDCSRQSPQPHQGSPHPAAPIGCQRARRTGSGASGSKLDRTGRRRIWSAPSRRVDLELPLSTSGGQKVTVNEASSTTYERGTSSAGRVRHHARPSSFSARPTDDHHSHPGRRDPTGYSASSSRCPFQQARRAQRSRSVRSRRATPRGRARSSADDATRRSKRRWPLPRRRRRPLSAEQRRVRGPHHGVNWRTRLRRPGLQGRRAN